MRVAKALADRGAAGRPRDQGRRARRPARARAPGRLRAAVRRRARADLPHGPRDQEPVRLDQRGRRVRDARRRPGRGPGRLGAVRGRGHARARQRRAVRDGGLAAAAGRGPGACLSLGARTAATGRRRESTATGWRWCWRCSAATPASALGSADVFVNVVGGVRVDEPGADLAVALAVASAVKRGARSVGAAASRSRASASSG